MLCGCGHWMEATVLRMDMQSQVALCTGAHLVNLEKMRVVGTLCSLMLCLNNGGYRHGTSTRNVQLDWRAVTQADST